MASQNSLKILVVDMDITTVMDTIMVMALAQFGGLGALGGNL